METVTKQPAEKWQISYDFGAAGRLPEGASLSSVVVSAFEVQTDEVSAVHGTGAIDETKAVVFIQGGVDGKVYQVTFTVTLDDTSILQEDFLLKVVRKKGRSTR